jgi:L-alanine-DL-glutamate epimerase-like enolase superfamily enzyme
MMLKVEFSWHRSRYRTEFFKYTEEKVFNHLKIENVQTYLIEFGKPSNALKEGEEHPVATTYGAIGKTQHVIVKITTDEDGIFGVGEASNFYITTPARRHLRPKETATTVISIIKEILAPAIIGENPLDLNLIYEKMDAWVEGHLSAKTAIDMALYDIAGKRAGLPVYALLGGAFRKEAPATAGVSLGRPEVMAKEAATWTSAGWKGVQIKLGGMSPNPALDVERVKKVREALGSDAIILADFNQAYTADQAIRILREVERTDVYAEQPTPACDLGALARVAHSISLPVIADEAFSYGGRPIRNLIEIIRTNAASVIKLKIQPLGGISVQRKIIDIAREYEIPLITDEGANTRLMDTALSHVTAVLNDNIFFPTSIGMTSLQTQGEIVKEGGMHIKNGIVTVPSAPGLGVELDWSILREV